MVRKEKQSSRATLSSDDMASAVQDVLDGKSLRITAVEHGVKFQTFQKYVAKKRTTNPDDDQMEPNSTVRRVFSEEQEISLCDYIKTCSIMSYGLTTIQALKADRNISNTRAEQAKRRALARKRAINQQVKPPKPTIVRYAVPHHLQEKMLDISQLQHLLRSKELTDAATQTENDQCLSQESLSIEKAHVQVQVHPTDLFDFNVEVQPIVEVLVAKTIEEALIEVLEEEELMAMKEQQRKFLEYMATNTSDEIESDFNENKFKNFSQNIFRNNYMPNLITSV
ncbi:unnamed protein product [Diabrotica balteata]|uniref:HTH psq-type domain-containing protein n=1 Tax=Diabrotica balteata TaxID=107213 RepID=A0A9N9XIQ2_DIABA|nr:unnamed protein product [Diabrotica balteata]